MRYIIAATIGMVLFFIGSHAAHAENISIDDIRAAIQQKGAQWTAEENPVFLLPADQRLALLGTLPEGRKSRQGGLVLDLPATGDLPSSLDWRNHNGNNYVTPVRDQDSCGSCWAFATIGGLESQVLLDTQSPGINLDLSEQILVSCSGAGTCDGGSRSSASAYLVSTGVNKEACFPYTALDSLCEDACQDWTSYVFGIDDWNYVYNDQGENPGLEDVKAALYQYGPLTCAFSVYEDFYAYGSGVYTYVEGEYQASHGVLLVGYDDVRQAFLVKNSWAETWGEDGFFWIAYSEMTGVTAFASQWVIAFGQAEVPEDCYFSEVTPANALVKPDGGDEAVSVNAAGPCAWTAASNATWITISQGAAGTGSGTVVYTVEPNTDSVSRQGSITVAGVTVTIDQAPHWKRTVLDSAGGIIANRNIAADSNGAAHIIYCRSGSLFYATNQSGAFTITSPATSAYSASMALDGQGHVHAAYSYGTDSPGIGYASNKTGTWQTECAMSRSGYVFSEPRVAVISDAQRIYISGVGFQEGETVGYLLTSNNDSGSFSTHKGLSNVYSHAMTMDSTYSMHFAVQVSYYDKLVHYLFDYGTGESTGSWINPYTSSGGVSLAVDASNIPHVLHNNASEKLVYSYQPGTWTGMAAGDSVPSNTPASLAIGPDGALCATYGDSQTGKLQFARLMGDQWRSYPLDQDHTYGGASSLFVDANGHGHVVYLEQDSNSLIYLTNSDADLCPDDPAKTEPGQCGCGVADTDSDGDGTADCVDGCPEDPAKTEPGLCGCGTPDTDTDNDGTPDCNDLCPEDPAKTEPGLCGCGVADTDTDNDGTPDCNDLCPEDPAKTAPGLCGCGTPDTDTDNDGTPDCNDLCPEDPAKTAPGLCGCGTPDTDTDNDGTPDCNDLCPEDPAKTAPGLCGCGVAETDTDNDGTPDCNDDCPEDPAKTAPGLCGCGTPDTDTDNDGTPDCNDLCPEDPAKTEPGLCGCGVAETDTDNDGTPDCNDDCPKIRPRQRPGFAGAAHPIRTRTMTALPTAMTCALKIRPRQNPGNADAVWRIRIRTETARLIA